VRNLGENLLFSTLILGSVYKDYVIFYWDSLSTIDSLSLNYPASSRFRTVMLVLSLKLLSPVISLPSYAFSTGSKSPNASNTSSTHLPTKFSQPPDLCCYSCSATNIMLSKKTDHSFHYASPGLWNKLPSPLRQPRFGASSSISKSPIPVVSRLG